MERITYRLENFEGPLDLLLHLIEKDKIDIYNIPIAEITEQYLDYVAALREEDLDIVSDFLVMAATLLEIKSRMLLPRELDEEGEEIDPRAELVARLLEYKRFKYMALLLRRREGSAAERLCKPPTIPREVEKYTPPIDLSELLRDVTADRLRTLLMDIVRRREDVVDQVRAKFGVIRREKISLQGRIRDVLEYARRHGQFSFRHMLRKRRGKMDIVVSFLAVLELMKMGKITLEQQRPFADMDIHVVEGAEVSERELEDVEDL